MFRVGRLKGQDQGVYPFVDISLSPVNAQSCHVHLEE